MFQRTAMRNALRADDPSVRLRAALAAGTQPDDALIDVLVERSGVEPDFFVRDMMTWALTRTNSRESVPRLLDELGSPIPQARSQALHTLSKIGDPDSWNHIPVSLLHDPDDEVARSAWRAAVILVPDNEKTSLATELAAELGRGDQETWRSLSRALVALGDRIVASLDAATASATDVVREHAAATIRLLEDPDRDVAVTIEQARRIASLRDAAIAPAQDAHRDRHDDVDR